jgi:hypothetical protein
MFGKNPFGYGFETPVKGIEFAMAMEIQEPLPLLLMAYQSFYLTYKYPI